MLGCSFLPLRLFVGLGYCVLRVGASWLGARRRGRLLCTRIRLVDCLFLPGCNLGQMRMCLFQRLALVLA